MRTPWALFVVFAVGVAAGAATAVLLRTEVAPAPAPAPSPAAPESASTWNPEPLNTAAPEAGPSFQGFTPTESELEKASANPRNQQPTLRPKLRMPTFETKGGITLAGVREWVQVEAGTKPPRSDGEAEAALRRIVAAPASEAVQEDRGEMFFLTSQLLSAGKDTGPLAEEFLKSQDAEVRRAGVNLAQGASPRVDLLLEATSDPDAAVRALALDSLDGLASDGRIAPRELERVVLAALRDPSSEVRCAAMRLLRRIGSSGAAEAARILRAGTHREIDADPGSLLEAALEGAATALLADPLPPHLAEDVGIGAGSLLGRRTDLLRTLAPHATRVLAALPPGARDPAASLLNALGVAGESAALRAVLLDPSFAPRIRAAAADPLSHLFPPREWESAVSSWLRDAGTDLEVRREFVTEHTRCFTRSEKDGDAAYEAWTRVLRAITRGADDPALAADAARMLEDICAR